MALVEGEEGAGFHAWRSEFRCEHRDGGHEEMGCRGRDRNTEYRNIEFQLTACFGQAWIKEIGKVADHCEADMTSRDVAVCCVLCADCSAGGNT